MFLVKILCVHEGVSWNLLGKQFPEKLQAESNEQLIWNEVNQQTGTEIAIETDEGFIYARVDDIRVTEVVEIISQSGDKMAPVSRPFTPQLVK